jgi:thioredoxin 1
MADKVATFTDGNWEKEVVGSATPVLVDFWAEWCQPCKALVPIIEAVAEKYGDKLRVGKLNVEENYDVPARYTVNGLPTLLLLKAGKVLEQRKSLISRDDLVKLVEPHLR